MTRSELIAQVRGILNEPTESFFFDTEIIDWLEAAEGEFVRQAPVLEEISTTDCNADNDKYDLPGDCIKLIRIEYDGDRLQELRLRDWDKLTDSGTEESGSPRYYHVFNTFIRLWPIPSEDGVDVLKIHYRRKPVELSNAGSIPEIPLEYHEALVFFAASRGKMKDGEEERANYYENKFNGILRHAQARARAQTADRFHVVRDPDVDDFGSYGVV